MAVLIPGAKAGRTGRRTGRSIRATGKGWVYYRRGVSSRYKQDDLFNPLDREDVRVMREVHPVTVEPDRGRWDVRGAKSETGRVQGTKTQAEPGSDGAVLSVTRRADGYAEGDFPAGFRPVEVPKI